MAFVEVGSPAESQIDRHEHQSRAVRDRHREGPEPQLRRSYPRQGPWMAPVDEPDDAEPDHKHGGADLYLALPFDQCNQQRKGKKY